VTPEIGSHPGSWWIGDGNGVRRQLAVAREKGLRRARDDPSVGEVVLRGPSGGWVDLDHREIATARVVSCGGEKPNASMEIEDRLVSRTDEGRDALEEPGNEVSVSLKKRTHGDFESDREIHVNVILTPAGKKMCFLGESVESCELRAVRRGRQPPGGNVPRPTARRSEGGDRLRSSLDDLEIDRAGAPLG